MNNIVHNNNYNNNDSENNIKLYNSVFNNIYIKKIIFKHLNKYNILYYPNIKFYSHEQWEQFKYKEYLNNITFAYNYETNQLPQNIKHINILSVNKYLINNLNSIPNHIESISFSTVLKDSDLNSILSITNSTILSKINKLFITENQIEVYNNNNEISQSITNLKIKGIIGVVENGILSKSLKRIELKHIKSIKNKFILESLSTISLKFCPPSIINQISSNALVKLEFHSYYGITIDSSIIFPETLQDLSLNCHIFSSKLPSNLKKLRLILSQFNEEIIFPSSLESIYITIGLNNKDVFKDKESIPCSLKSLEMNCSSIVDNNGESILHDKIERLVLMGFNQVLLVNQLPSSLAYLDLGNTYNQVINANVLPSSLTYLNTGNAYNQIIDLNVLPSNLKTLIFGFIYSQIINPFAIPQQLELLEIRNLRYKFSVILPVSTHPNTQILCYDINLYYNISNTSIRVLRLPDFFYSPLSTLKLQDKSSLEYLHLGKLFNIEIQLSDLPINNNIKTIILSYDFYKTINLEYFPKLETIKLKKNTNLKIITTKTITNQHEIIYNYYNLKNIIVPSNNNRFLENLDINFFQFLKIDK